MTLWLKPLPDDLPEGRRELAEAVRKALQNSNKSLRQIARDAHVTPGGLSLIASGQRKPTDATLENILRAACPAEERRRKGAGKKHTYLTKHWRMLLIAAVWVGAACGLVGNLLAGMEGGRNQPDPRIPADPWPTETSGGVGDPGGSTGGSGGSGGPEPTPADPPPWTRPPMPSPSPGALPGLILGGSSYGPAPLYERPNDKAPKEYVTYGSVVIECAAGELGGQRRYRVSLQVSVEGVEERSGQEWYIEEQFVAPIDPETGDLNLTSLSRVRPCK